MKTIIFNSSLPRSGSTLLQNILAQNPTIYSSATSGVIELLYSARNSFTESIEFKAQDSNVMDVGFNGFCLGGIQGWYQSITDRPVCVDKSRAWIHYYEWIERFISNPKILVCIRDIRGIIASMEKNWRANMNKNDPADVPTQMNFITRQNRVQTWLSNVPVGIALQRLYGAIEREKLRSMCVIRFEDLTTRPRDVMTDVYNYLELPYFEHDFNNVQQITKEDDSIYGMYGDHVIRNKVEPVPPYHKELLGPDISQSLINDNKWFYNLFYSDQMLI